MVSLAVPPARRHDDHVDHPRLVRTTETAREGSSSVRCVV